MQHLLTKRDVTAIFSRGSAGLITCQIMAGTDGREGGMWHRRAMQMLHDVGDAICELRKKKLAPCENGLTAAIFQDQLSLEKICELSENEGVSSGIRQRLKAYVEALPRSNSDLSVSLQERARDVIYEQHGYVLMQAGGALQQLVRIEGEAKKRSASAEAPAGAAVS